LSLINNVPPIANPGLESIQLYLADGLAPASIPVQQWMSTHGWEAFSYGVNVPSTGAGSAPDEIDWIEGASGSALPTGTYVLGVFPGWTASSFGSASGLTVDGPLDSSNNRIGAVTVFSNAGQSDLQSVAVINAIPSENDWIGASGGLWGVAGNWSLSSGTSTHRVPTSTDTATFGNQYGNLSVGAGGVVNVIDTQSVGSLAFNCSNSYTIQATSGTSGMLSLSNTANITVDAGVHTIAVPLALSGSLTVDAEGNGAAGLVISAQISGTSNLVKTGPGTLWLSSTNNTYSGNTQIDGGVLVAAAPGSLGASGAITINNGTLDFSGQGTFARSIVLAGSGTNTIQTDAGVMGLTTVTGTGGLTKAGLGTLAIDSGSTYTGGTTISAGTLQMLAAATALSNSSGLSIAGGASLDLNGLSPVLPNISGAGVVTNGKLATTSTLSAASPTGSATYTAAIQDGAGYVAVNVPSGNLLTVSNPVNAYSGGTSVSGTLSISADGNLGSPSSGVTLNNGTLQLNGNFTVGSGRAISLAGSSAFDVPAGQSAMIAGVISDGLQGSAALTKTDDGGLSLTGANTYSGGTVINGGTLAVANDAALGATGGGVTINNGTLQVSGGTISHDMSFAGPSLYLSVTQGTCTLAGVMSGTSALVKTGPGTLVLANPNNSAGLNGIVVTGGTLLSDDQTGSSLGSGTAGIQVTAGGGLAGTAQVFQNVTLSGHLMAGDSNAMGMLTFQNGLTLTQGAVWTLRIDANGNSDSLDFGSDPVLTNPSSRLAFSGTGALVATGTPLPNPDGYTIITDDHDTGGSEASLQSTFQTHLPVKAPPGFMGIYAVQRTQSGLTSDYRSIDLTFIGPTEWTQPGGGAWSDDFNWTNGSPNNTAYLQKGAMALFGANGHGTVSLPGSGQVTYVNALLFNNSSSSYTLSGGSAWFSNIGITQDGRYEDKGAAYVEVISGRHTIATSSYLGCALDISTLDPGGVVTFSGALSGSGSLVVSGSGDVILSGNNSFSGGTTISGGELTVANTAALPGPITFSGGLLQFTSAAKPDYSAKIVNSASPISIDTNGQTVTFGDGVGSSNTGGLVKIGNGGLVLSGTNSYTGGTTVEAGTLYLTGTDSILPGSPLTVLEGGTVIFDPSAILLSPVTAGAVTSPISSVPEPGTLALLVAATAVGCIAVRGGRRRRN